MCEIDFSRPVHQFWPKNRGASKNPPVGSNRNCQAQKVAGKKCNQNLAEVENECVRSIFWYGGGPGWVRGGRLNPNPKFLTSGGLKREL